MMTVSLRGSARSLLANSVSICGRLAIAHTDLGEEVIGDGVSNYRIYVVRVKHELLALANVDVPIPGVDDGRQEGDGEDRQR